MEHLLSAGFKLNIPTYSHKSPAEVCIIITLFLQIEKLMTEKINNLCKVTQL